ncbi:MAG TPA: hypothetical protein VKA48_07840, partial [Gammaproteobacteria bacterium]|nr:hypothetical protein [Gammaproteobacteria bacterium]
MNREAQQTPQKRSPVHETPMAQPVPRPGLPEDALVWRVVDPAAESPDPARLGLADLSAMPRLGVKGPGAEEFLRPHGVTPPEGVYRWAELEGGAVVVRTGSQEYFVEDGAAGGTVAGLDTDLGFGGDGVY